MKEQNEGMPYSLVNPCYSIIPSVLPPVGGLDAIFLPAGHRSFEQLMELHLADRTRRKFRQAMLR